MELHLPAECRETLPEPLSVHETESNTILSPLLPARESDSTTIRKDESREEPQLRPHAETERLPKPRQRLVKSATARQQRHTDIPTYPPRPKTVGGTTRGVHLLPLKGASVLEQHLELKEGLCGCNLDVSASFHYSYTINTLSVYYTMPYCVHYCILYCTLFVYYTVYYCILYCTLFVYYTVYYCILYCALLYTLPWRVGGVHRHAVSEQGLMLEGKSLRSVGSTHQRLVTDGVHQLVDLEEATALKVSMKWRVQS